MTLHSSRNAEFAWLQPSDDTREAARFFAENLDTRYISHSELQIGRASGPGRWADDLEEMLRTELAHRATLPFDPSKRDDASHTALMHEDGTLRGIANLDFHYPRRAAAYCILEDIVVDRSVRGRGLGTQLFLWIEDACRMKGISRLFFESGIDNEEAHKLFERLGCRVVSHYFMKEL